MRFSVLIGLLGLALAACGGQDRLGAATSAEAYFARCSALSAKKKFEEAVECLEIFKSRFAGSHKAMEAELHIGDTFFRQEDYLLAAESYDSFLRNHPLHARADYALYRLGSSYLLAAPKAIDRDQEHLTESIDALERQLRLFPRSRFRKASEDALRDALRRLGERHYYIGNFYYRTAEYRAAIPRLLIVVQEFPHIEKLPKAYRQLTLALARIGLFEEARATYTQMHKSLPDHALTKKTEESLRRLATKHQASPAPKDGAS